MKKEKSEFYNNHKNAICLSIILFLLVSIVSTFCINTKYAYAANNQTKRNQWYNPMPNYWYYYDSNGKLATGLYEVDFGKAYYFNTDSKDLGRMQTGWKKIGDETYYFNESTSEGDLGLRHKGWLKKYKSDSSGYNWYYFDESGKLLTGVHCVDGGTDDYYFSTDSKDLGSMQTGWQKINNKTYYFDEYTNNKTKWGFKHKGWLKQQKPNSPDYNWYFFNESGDIVTGWYEKGPNVKYYFSDSFTEYGAMKTGVVTINGARYYFKSDGILACNTTINGYKTDGNGRIV